MREIGASPHILFDLSAGRTGEGLQHVPRAVGTGIVHADDLDWRQRLSEDALDCLLNERGAVMARDDDGDTHAEDLLCPCVQARSCPCPQTGATCACHIILPPRMVTVNAN